MEKDYEEFIEAVKKKYKIDLGKYKDNQMVRRLKTFYTKKGCNSFKEYFELITKDKNEEENFLDKITINVTEFYRNRERWEDLSEMIKEMRKPTINVLSAACSSGEEVYTVKMMADKIDVRAKINAVDIDKNSLEKAKRAVYEDYSIEKLKEDEIKKYFDKKDDEYYIKNEYKKDINFLKMNLLEDQFREKYDLIICRNVMIYFKEEAKGELYEKFNRSLKENGLLYVGSTEQIFNPEKYGFEIVRPFFYKRKGK